MEGDADATGNVLAGPAILDCNCPTRRREWRRILRLMQEYGSADYRGLVRRDACKKMSIKTWQLVYESWAKK